MKKRHQLSLLIARLLAYGADFLLVALICGSAQFIAYNLLDGFPFDNFTKPVHIYSWVLCTLSVPTWLYFIKAERSAGLGTVGKKLFGLQVIDRRGSKISGKQALGRTAIKLLPWEITHIALMDLYFKPEPAINAGFIIANSLAFIYLFFFLAKKGKWTLHDLLTGTRVIPAAGQ